jgi:hypothetical protein
VPAAGGVDPAAVAALVEGAERLAQEIYAGVAGRTLQ